MAQSSNWLIHTMVHLFKLSLVIYQLIRSRKIIFDCPQVTWTPDNCHWKLPSLLTLSSWSAAAATGESTSGTVTPGPRSVSSMVIITTLSSVSRYTLRQFNQTVLTQCFSSIPSTWWWPPPAVKCPSGYLQLRMKISCSVQSCFLMSFLSLQPKQTRQPYDGDRMLQTSELYRVINSWCCW